MYDSSPSMGKSVLLLSSVLPTKPLSLASYHMVNNQTSCVIMIVIADYDDIYNVINYNYIISGNSYYWKSCNLLPNTPNLMQTNMDSSQKDHASLNYDTILNLVEEGEILMLYISSDLIML